MSLLLDILKSYDTKTLSKLIVIIESPAIDLLNKLPINRRVDEPVGHAGKLRARLIKSLAQKSRVESFLGEEAIILNCLKVTAERLKIKERNWSNSSEEEIIHRVYNRLVAITERRLAKMSDKKRDKLISDFKVKLEMEGKSLIGGGSALMGMLAAGEAAGFALFTSTAVGLKAIGLLLGTTFSFGTYSTTMAVMRIIFGAAGFGVAAGVIALGGWGMWRSLFSFGTYGTTLAVMGIIIGAAGFGVAAGVIALGGWKMWRALQIKKVLVITLTLVQDYIIQEQAQLRADYAAYIWDLSSKVREYNEIIEMANRYFESDRSHEPNLEEADWYQRLRNELVDLELSHA